jgi:hypothetical protein
MKYFTGEYAEKSSRKGAKPQREKPVTSTLSDFFQWSHWSFGIRKTQRVVQP